MESLLYHDLRTFINLCATGEIKMNQVIEIPNVTHDRRIHMSFLKHSIHLSKQFDTNILHILTQIKYRIKEDILSLINSNPYVRNYIQMILQEWGLKDVVAGDIFIDGLDNNDKYSDDYDMFDYEGFINTQQLIDDLEEKRRSLEDEVNQMNLDVKKINHSITSFLDECIECKTRLTNNLSELTDKQELIEPTYKYVLFDLSVKHKPQYLDKSHLSDGSSKMSDFLTTTNASDIPDTIHDIFMNYLLCSNMILKEFLYLSFTSKDLLMIVSEKHDHAYGWANLQPNVTEVSSNEVYSNDDDIGSKISQVFDVMSMKFFGKDNEQTTDSDPMNNQPKEEDFTITYGEPSTVLSNSDLSMPGLALQDSESVSVASVIIVVQGIHSFY